MHMAWADTAKKALLVHAVYHLQHLSGFFHCMLKASFNEQQDRKTISKHLLLHVRPVFVHVKLSTFSKLVNIGIISGKVGIDAGIIFEHCQKAISIGNNSGSSLIITPLDLPLEGGLLCWGFVTV